MRVKLILAGIGVLIFLGKFKAIKSFLLKLFGTREKLKTITWLKESHGGHLAANVFLAHGVKQIFTLTGGHIAPILTGSEELGIRVVDVRHECTAAFAADAISRTTGTVGVAVVTAGPGLTNTITAVKNAQMAQSPLLLIGGATSDLLKGRGSLQDIDQSALLAPHVKWMAHISRVQDIVPVLEEAFYRAKEGVPGPVFVEFPLDTLYPKQDTLEQFEKEKPRGPGLVNSIVRWYINRHLNNLFKDIERIDIHKAVPIPTIIGAGWQISQAARMISQSKRPVLLIGAQAVMNPDTTQSLIHAIEVLNAPVWLSSCARGLLGRKHKFQFKHCRSNALKESDLVILMGVVMDFRLGYGMRIKGSTAIISVNLDKSDLYKNRTPTLAILADPSKALIQISDNLKSISYQPHHQSWLDQCATLEEGRNKEIEAMAKQSGDLVNPVLLCQEIEKVMSSDAVIVADGGDIVATFSYAVNPRGPRGWLDPGPFGTLGVGGGFALGAACAFPNKELWLIWGDGACGFSIAELDTFVRHKLPVICVVGNDAAWMQILRDQVRILGKGTAGTLTYQNYDRVAVGFGAEGILITKPEELSEKLLLAKKLAAEGRPVLVNVHIAKSAFREGSISM